MKAFPWRENYLSHHILGCQAWRVPSIQLPQRRTHLGKTQLGQSVYFSCSCTFMQSWFHEKALEHSSLWWIERSCEIIYWTCNSYRSVSILARNTYSLPWPGLDIRVPSTIKLTVRVLMLCNFYGPLSSKYEHFLATLCTETLCPLHSGTWCLCAVQW